MSEAVKIDPGNVTFETAKGQKFAVPVMSFARELRQLADKCAAENLEHYAYLHAIVDLVKERFQADLTTDEADWFKDQLEIEHAKKKQKQAESLRGTLNSLYSLGSPSSDSATTS